MGVGDDDRVCSTLHTYNAAGNYALSFRFFISYFIFFFPIAIGEDPRSNGIGFPILLGIRIVSL